MILLAGRSNTQNLLPGKTLDFQHGGAKEREATTYRRGCECGVSIVSSPPLESSLTSQASFGMIGVKEQATFQQRSPHLSSHRKTCFKAMCFQSGVLRLSCGSQEGADEGTHCIQYSFPPSSVAASPMSPAGFSLPMAFAYHSRQKVCPSSDRSRVLQLFF